MTGRDSVDSPVNVPSESVTPEIPEYEVALAKVARILGFVIALVSGGYFAFHVDRPSAWLALFGVLYGFCVVSSAADKIKRSRISLPS
jgi:hypothetical protein